MTSELKDLYRRGFSRLCAYAALLLGSAQEAEDVVSDVFLDLLQLPDLHIDNVEGYVVTCIRNRCIQILRKSSGKSRIKLAELISEAAADVSCIQQENEVLFGAAIDGLPEMTRKVFLLNKRDGLSYKDIARQLNIAESTVRVHVFNAVRSLSDKLKIHLTKI